MSYLLCNQTVVKNILAGTQTQDRRPMKVQPDMSFFKSQCPADGRQWDERDAKWELEDNGWYLSIPGVSQGPFNAPSKVGDILGIIEDTMFVRACRKLFPGLWGLIWRYYVVGWVEVTEVRCERIQDISTGDCCREGVTTLTELNMALSRTDKTPFDVQNRNRARKLFGNLWNTLYPGSWDRNDYVWVRTFKKVDKPERGIS